MVQIKMFKNATEEEINKFLAETKGKLVTILQSENIMILDQDNIIRKGMNLTIVYSNSITSGMQH